MISHCLLNACRSRITIRVAPMLLMRLIGKWDCSRGLTDSVGNTVVQTAASNERELFDKREAFLHDLMHCTAVDKFIRQELQHFFVYE